MLKTTKAIYRNERLVLKEKKGMPKEGAEVIVIFEVKKKKGRAKRSSLYGIWKERFPDTFDINNALKDIRTGWKKRLEYLQER